MPSLDSLFSIEYVVTNSSSPLPAHLETQLGHIRVDPGLCKVHVCQGYRGDILGGVDHSVSGWTEIISPTPESVQPLTESGPTPPIDSCAMVRKSHELKTIYSREQPIDYGESTLTSRLWCIRDRVVYCPCFQCMIARSHPRVFRRSPMRFAMHSKVGQTHPGGKPTPSTNLSFAYSHPSL